MTWLTGAITAPPVIPTPLICVYFCPDGEFWIRLLSRERKAGIRRHYVAITRTPLPITRYKPRYISTRSMVRLCCYYALDCSLEQGTHGCACRPSGRQAAYQISGRPYSSEETGAATPCSCVCTGGGQSNDFAAIDGLRTQAAVSHPGCSDCDDEVGGAEDGRG
uniref:Uncharacterized protein n=1 Tax=Phytophthora fragariae TaxID=53985 RepID=A0A6A3F002_9STRA|nr:hypothetical protein PF009_g10981 [Phytophthora fragariae]